MKKENEMVYVIKDEDGNFVSDGAFTLTIEGWLYFSFTGDTTGFIWYSEGKGAITAEEELKKLQDINKKYGFNKKFYIEYINFQEIKQGEGIIKNIFHERHIIKVKKNVNVSK